jgi:hypothetical protein
VEIGYAPLAMALAGICILLIAVVLIQTILFTRERTRLYAMVTQKPVSFFEPNKSHPATTGESKAGTGKNKRVWVENMHGGVEPGQK